MGTVKLTISVRDNLSWRNDWFGHTLILKSGTTLHVNPISGVRRSIRGVLFTTTGYGDFELKSARCDLIRVPAFSCRERIGKGVDIATVVSNVRASIKRHLEGLGIYKYPKVGITHSYDRGAGWITAQSRPFTFEAREENYAAPILFKGHTVHAEWGAVRSATYGGVDWDELLRQESRWMRTVL